jgi:membrane fusion protein (multidrug efflux system)
MKAHLVAITLFTGLLSGCEHQNNTEAHPAQPSAPTSVEAVSVASRKLDMNTSLPAQLLPYESVDIYPRVTGFLDSIRVDVGSHVRKGEELMRISAPELAAQRSQSEAGVHAAESQLATAQAKLASDQGTYSHLAAAARTPGVVAQNDVLIAEQTVAAEKGAVAAAEHNVTAARDSLRSVAQMESYLTISAPFSGVVTMRNLHPGALTGPAAGQAGAQPIVRIVDTNRLRLVVPIPEAEVGEMKQGQSIAFTVPAFPGEIFHAPIARIAHDVDVSTRTMHVELDVQNPNGKLTPGSFATVSWPIRRAAESMFVPTTSVTADQQQTFVIRVRDGKAQWVNVQTGETLNGEVEVFGDLHTGDQVVRIASDSILNGQNVSVRVAKHS